MEAKTRQKTAQVNYFVLKFHLENRPGSLANMLTCDLVGIHKMRMCESANVRMSTS